MDHYQTLGVPRTATEKEIKQAYRRLAGQHHPDRPGGDTVRFQQIEEAYRTLSDPASREQYDHPRSQFTGFPGGFDFGNFGGNPFEDVLNQFARQQRSPRQMIFSATVFVTLEQVASGAVETIQVQTDTGPRTFQIRIPQSVEDGQRIRYDGLMPTGPLMITFRLHRHAIFERRGMDLYMNHDVSVFDLILGTTIVVPTIRGQQLEIRVPPHTRPGSTLRIPDHGLESPNRRGCQFILIVATIPDTISEQLVLALEQERANKSPKHQG